MKAANEYILSMAVRKNICPSKSVWEALPSIHVYFHCSDNIHPLSIVNSWACPSTSFPKGVISSFLRTLFLFINWINRYPPQDPPVLPYVWLYRTSAGYLYYREYYRTVIIKIPKLFVYSRRTTLCLLWVQKIWMTMEQWTLWGQLVTQ